MIDKKLEYQTRDGREVRIYATDGGKDYPIHGAIFEHGEWIWAIWPDSGKGSEEAYDLVPKPKPERTAFVNFYDDARRSNVHNSRESADKEAAKDRIACVRITYREYEGL